MKAYLFTGESSYLLTKELTRWIQGFRTKYSVEPMIFSDENMDVDVLGQELLGGGFFSTTKLIIIYNLPAGTTNDTSYKASLNERLEAFFTDNRSSISDDCRVIFVSPKADKRKKFYTYLSKNCDHKTYPAMDAQRLPGFVAETYQSFLDPAYTQCVLPDADARYMVARIGSNDRRLANESMKLACAVNAGATLNRELITQVVVSSPDSDTFGIHDALYRDSSKIMDLLSQMRESGEATQAILGVLLWALKQLMSVASVAGRADFTDSMRKEELGLHPFVSGGYKKNLLTIIGRYDQYRRIYISLLDYDYQLKTGTVSEEAFFPRVKTCLVQNHLL